MAERPTKVSSMQKITKKVLLGQSAQRTGMRQPWVKSFVPRLDYLKFKPLRFLPILLLLASYFVILFYWVNCHQTNFRMASYLEKVGREQEWSPGLLWPEPSLLTTRPPPEPRITVIKSHSFSEGLSCVSPAWLHQVELRLKCRQPGQWDLLLRRLRMRQPEERFEQLPAQVGAILPIGTSCLAQLQRGTQRFRLGLFIMFA